MGTDNLFHKRKAKQAKDLERRKAVRRRYEKVLIVCEGEKTEPLYFNELKDYYELDTANITISGQCGSDPLSVVDYGYKLYKDEIQNDDECFDKVFCVFDKDQHQTYQAALAKIRTLRPVGTFTAVTSVPCFELWLLLHFRYASAPIISNGGKSSGARTMSELRKHWPDYEKATCGSFFKLLDRLNLAKTHAETLKKHCASIGTDNPTTEVYELVNYLQALKA